jgi:hypothetical protein
VLVVLALEVQSGQLLAVIAFLTRSLLLAVVLVAIMMEPAQVVLVVLEAAHLAILALVAQVILRVHLHRKVQMVLAA